jgi:hypothetical protein
LSVGIGQLEQPAGEPVNDAENKADDYHPRNEFHDTGIMQFMIAKRNKPLPNDARIQPS